MNKIPKQNNLMNKRLSEIGKQNQLTDKKLIYKIGKQKEIPYQKPTRLVKGMS